MNDTTTVRLADGTIGQIALFDQGVQDAIDAKIEITVQLNDENGMPIFKSGIPDEILE